jgi:hypothetical protein
MSHYEEGTFIRNRKAVYDMLYDGAFSYVFSGHSHRAGFCMREIHLVACSGWCGHLVR